MVIRNTTSVGGVDSAARQPQSDAAAPRRQSDSVSMADADRAAAVARAAQTKVGMSRTARLAQVEDAIHAGTYYPSASQLASQLLDAAEIDARLQNIVKG